MSNTNTDVESGDNKFLDGNTTREELISRVRTAGSISISPELFEVLYLNPKTQQTNSHKWGVPTGLAAAAFSLNLFFLAGNVLGWQGSGQLGTAMVGSYYYCAVIHFLVSVLEFFLGNTFSYALFGCFGMFWFTFPSVFVPAFGSGQLYTVDGTVAAGLTNGMFNSTIGMYMLFWAVLTFLFLVASLRTNLVLFVLLLTLFFAFVFFAAGYITVGHGNASYAATLLKAGGSFAVVTSIMGFYLTFALFLHAVDFPVLLPLIDFSTRIRGYSETHKD